MPLYVYAVLGDPPRAETGAGVAGEPLRVVSCGDLLIAVGDVRETPRLDPDTLRAHDAIVRRLATVVEALLPARFGSVLRDERSLELLLEPRRSELLDALRLVAGGEQMTLRVFGEEITDRQPLLTDDSVAGPGARYLTERAQAERRARSVPEIDWLRPALAAFVRAERAERHRTAPLMASVHHLIRRGDASAYLSALENARAGAHATVRVVASGPWPPYAFAPDATS